MRIFGVQMVAVAALWAGSAVAQPIIIPLGPQKQETPPAVSSPPVAPPMAGPSLPSSSPQQETASQPAPEPPPPQN